MGEGGRQRGRRKRVKRGKVGMAKLYSGKFMRKVGEEKVWQCNRGGRDGVYERENIGRGK